MKKLLFFFIVMVSVNVINSQIKINGVGGYVGLGSIKGNSASVSSFTTSLFVDTKMFFTEDVTIRYSFFYARKLEALLPDASGTQYFPYHRGFSVKAVIEQLLSTYLFLEEGLGLLLLNDRTFSDTNEWGIGAAFHITIGLDFRSYKNSGFKLGLGSDIGTTFNATTPNYFSVQLQTAYYF